MKTIGIIGGTSWHSTQHYYRIINEYVNRELGEQNAARIIMSSINFQDIYGPPDWDKLGAMFTAEAKHLEQAGADFFIICSNGLHKIAPQLEAAVSIPFLSIIDCAAKEIIKKGLKKVGLIGTKGTMVDGYYQERLATFGIETITPEREDRRTISDIIFSELTLGKFTDGSRTKYIEIIEKLAAEGSEGVILGCTEIPLLVQQQHTKVPLFDTLTIHAKAAARFSLQ